MSWISKNSLIARRRFRVWAACGFAAIFLYPLLLMILGDERVSDGTFDWGEPNWLETLIFVHGFVLMLTLWMSVIAHAWDAKRWWWVFFSFVAWPVAYVYAFRFGEKEGPSQLPNNGSPELSLTKRVNQ